MAPAVESCNACEHRGRIPITVCPATYVGREVWEMVELSRWAEKGAWPVGGGTLDQTDAFLKFHATWLNARDRMKAEQHG